jgi:DNA gyrase subunit A
MVEDIDHLLILTSGGRIIRLRMDQISVIGRNTMGRTLVRMEPGEHVVDVARAEPSDEDDSDSEAIEPEADLDSEEILSEDDEGADED